MCICGDPEAVAVAKTVTRGNGNHPGCMTRHAVITDILQQVVRRNATEIPGYHGKWLRGATLPDHDGLVIRHDAGDCLVIAQHLACTAGQGNQAFTLPALVHPADNAHRLEFAIMEINKGAIVIECLQCSRHSIQPLPGTLLCKYLAGRCQQHYQQQPHNFISR